MAFREYGNYDGIGLADLVRKKQVSAAELLDEAIARTAKVDPEINAVVVKHYDYARRQIDRGLPDGPFTGVPFLLKDLDLLETTRTTFGASVFKENVADHTGTLAQRFLDSGVTMFGKSSSPEFGLLPTTESRLFGPTRNPWNLAHSSGGSSRGPCQRRRRFDTHSRLRIRRVRYEAEPRAQSARPRSRRRLGRVFLWSRREHQRARQRGDAGCDPWARSIEPLCRAAAGTAFFPGGRTRSGPAANRVYRQVALWRCHRSRDCGVGPGSRRPAGRARPSCRATGACAGRRSGGRDGDHRGRQHRAQRAARRTALRPRDDGQRLRDIDDCQRP